MMLSLRNKLLVFALALGVLFLFAACRAEEPLPLPEVFPETKEKQEILVEQVMLDSDNDLTIRIVNNTDNQLMYGEGYRLLAYDGTSWEYVDPIRENAAYPAIAYVIEPGEQKEHTYPVGSVYPMDDVTHYYFQIRIREYFTSYMTSSEREEYTYGFLIQR